jgi:stage V sporulation protein SpoVS
MYLRNMTIVLVLMTGCVSGAVKDAVKAYAIAADGVAQVGAALVTECAEPSSQDATQEARRKASCDKAKKSFETLQTSATSLQKIQ